MIIGGGDRGAFSTLISSTSLERRFHRLVSEVPSDVRTNDALSASTVASAPARSRLRDGWFATTATLWPRRKSDGAQLRGTTSWACAVVAVCWRCRRRTQKRPRPMRSTPPAAPRQAPTMTPTRWCTSFGALVVAKMEEEDNRAAPKGKDDRSDCRGREAVLHVGGAVSVTCIYDGVEESIELAGRTIGPFVETTCRIAGAPFERCCL